jgi:CHAT domain-containing protein
LSNDHNPPVLLVGDPAFPVGDPAFPSERLEQAREEVTELARDDYRGAEVLTDTAATVRNFLAKARNAGIIHFAGHGLASPQLPWQSRLLLAPDGAESGELSAEQLMKELPVLERTRLVVLGACSSVGGGPLGPQGLPPLVRPLIGAGVPAVVGTLWDVRDASSKQLLVSLHCHYRHGDDVAVALRYAQLEMLRKQEPTMTAMHWAAFQVVGYAASPYPRRIALEDSNSEHLCTQNSFLGPDGLHPQ